MGETTGKIKVRPKQEILCFTACECCGQDEAVRLYPNKTYELFSVTEYDDGSVYRELRTTAGQLIPFDDKDWFDEFFEEVSCE